MARRAAGARKPDIRDLVDGDEQQTPAPVSDQTSSEDAPKIVNAKVEFRGRTIEVHPPSPEQLVIIGRLETVFNAASKQTSISAERAIKLMGRALRAACSVVVKPDDAEFLEDLWLDGDLTLPDTLPFITSAIRALEEANADVLNRAERRAVQKSSGKVGGSELVTST